MTDSFPTSTGPLVGRGPEIDECVTELGRRVPFFCLLGPPGVGKSRLAREALARLRPSATGVYGVDLGGIRCKADAVRALLSGLRVADLEAARRTLANADRPLLFLDNAEELLHEAAPVVEEWRAHFPFAQFLVTSRVRLRIRGEVNLAVNPLPEAEATELFLQLGRVVRRDLPRDEEERAAMVTLVREFSGLPLWIQLAAERVGLLSPIAMLEMPDRRRILRKRGGPTGDRSGSAEDALEVSWGLLDESQREALAALSVVTGPFSLEAAEALLGEEQGIDLLETLVEHSLVRGQLRDAPDRFVLYKPIREFAARKRDASATLAARQTHANYFSERARRVGLRGMKWAHEGEDVVAAIEFSLEQAAVETSRVIVELESMLAQAVPLPRLTALVGAALDALPVRLEVQGLRARMLVLRGRLCRRAGWLAEAEANLQEAQRAAEAAADGGLQAIVEEASHENNVALGGPASTRHAQLEASAMWFDSASGVETGATVTTIDLRACEKTLGALRRAGQLRSSAVVQTRLASVLYKLGDFEGALGEATEAEGIHRDLGAMGFEGIASYIAGLAEVSLGRIAAASHRFDRVDILADELQSPLLSGYAARGRALLAVETGDAVRGRAELVKAREALATGGDSETLAETDAILSELGPAPLPGGSGDLGTDGRVLEVGETWFVAAGKGRVDLSRRRALRLIIHALARSAGTESGRKRGMTQSELLAAGWPGERILRSAAGARLWTAIRTLRDLGLRDWLVTYEDGYGLAPDVRVVTTT